MDGPGQPHATREAARWERAFAGHCRGRIWFHAGPLEDNDPAGDAWDQFDMALLGNQANLLCSRVD